MTEGDLADLERSTAKVQWAPADGTERTEHYQCVSLGVLRRPGPDRFGAKRRVTLYA